MIIVLDEAFRSYRMPNSSPSRLKGLARRLLAYEASSGNLVDTTESTAFRVFEKLRGPLGKLMGVGGFHSLLSRALTLAGAEVPSLRALHIKPDGSLEGLDELEANFDSGVVDEGEVVLAAHLLGLLVTFIGAALTLQLLHDVWPTMDDLNF